VTRRRKLFTAGLILALGLVLSWPFRKAPNGSEQSYSPAEMQTETPRASNGDPIASAHMAPPTQIPVAPDQVVAHVASAKEPAINSNPNELESFDLANHPAIANAQDSLITESAAPLAASTESRPVYSTVELAPDVGSQWPEELIHVVANGDTLEKLAERYLNDAGRALEIFDLNRDQLTNPHLLPIGVELRVPVDPSRIID
jgi:nucleoid-associated protein YgaU